LSNQKTAASGSDSGRMQSFVFVLVQLLLKLLFRRFARLYRKFFVDVTACFIYHRCQVSGFRCQPSRWSRSDHFDRSINFKKSNPHIMVRSNPAAARNISKISTWCRKASWSTLKNSLLPTPMPKSSAGRQTAAVSRVLEVVRP